MKKQLTIRLECFAFPGKVFGEYSNVHLAVQQEKETVWEIPGDAVSQVFDIPVFVSEGKDGAPNFLGKFAHGNTGDKFLYLVWYEKSLHNQSFRRAKIKLNHLTWADVEKAIAEQAPIVAEVKLTDKKGGPVCASLKPEQITWK